MEMYPNGKTLQTDPLLAAPSTSVQPVIVPIVVQSHASSQGSIQKKVEVRGNMGRRRSSVVSEVVTFWSSHGGLVMALLASVFFSCAMLLIKTMEQHGLKAFGGALLLNAGITVPCIVAILIYEFGPGWRHRPRIFQSFCSDDSEILWKSIVFLVIQGVLQGAAIIFRTAALQFLSIGDMTVIVFSSPVVTTIIAHFVLKEKCGFVFIGIAIFTLVGVVLITKPPMLTGEKGFDSKTLTGFALAAGALLSLSLTFVVTRKIKEHHTLVMTLSIGLVGLVMSIPLFLLFEDWSSIVPDKSETIALTLGFLMTFCAMASIVWALKMENAGLVALVRSCDVIFAFLLQFVFLGVAPDLLSGIGATIVWLGVLLAGSHKYWSDKKEREARHKRRKQLAEGIDG